MKAPRTIRFSALDFKVGFRMLARYPGLTVVGTVAIAVAIALGTLYFEAISKFMNPRLPSADPDRIVSIQTWDASAMSPENRLLTDYKLWREQVKTIAPLGASVTFVRNLATDDGLVQPVRGAEITSNAFKMLGVAPIIGRTFTAQDERPSEAPVTVISHALWKNRFNSEPGVIGRAVKLGTANATIIGVMPEGFGFPKSERIWTPLRVDDVNVAPRTGPAMSVFGRLAPTATMASAQAELNVIGARLSTTYPETHKQLRPRVTTYGKPLTEGGVGQLIRNVLYVVNGIFLMLLGVISANVATLVFARTATRGWEITVRSALGASRGRIISQLFIEALVLASLAAVVGLGAAKVALRFGLGMLGGNDALPYWINDNLSWTTVLYTIVLTLVGAAIVGILPALRVTRINVQDALRNESAARSGLRFGGFWTAVIVIQTAITVAFMPLAAGGVFESNRFRQRAEGIGAEKYLTAGVAMDREGYATDSGVFNSRARQSLQELERRLSIEPGIERVTFSDRMPVEDQFKYQIDVDTLIGGPKDGLRVSTLVHVGRNFFPTFGTSLVAGRDFSERDFETGNVLVVNQSFVNYVLGGRNAVGQRIKIVNGEDSRAATKDFLEIVGVVKDFGWQLQQPQEQSAMYRPSLPVVGRAEQIAIRARDTESLAPRLRAIAAAVDPTIRLTDVKGLADAGGGEAQMNWALTGVAWLISFIVLLLSATGIHSLMSFTVSRRTREIGIRVALGARPGRVVRSIFSRAFIQIGAGIVAGSVLASLLGIGDLRSVLLLIGADVVMLIVGLTACAVPLRRALRIDPTEALRAEA
jgi:predicted permease